MKSIIKFAVAALFAVVLAFNSFGTAHAEKPKPKPNTPKVEQVDPAYTKALQEKAARDAAAAKPVQGDRVVLLAGAGEHGVPAKLTVAGITMKIYIGTSSVNGSYPSKGGACRVGLGLITIGGVEYPFVPGV